MKNLHIKIFKGKQSLIQSDINIVIDVFRAFTVSHYAFLKGVDKIIITNSIQEAFLLKREKKDIILSGEVNGFKIKDFDYGNSPYEIYNADIKDKILVQKTTNGVQVALASLDTKYLFVTGYTNAYVLSKYILQLIKKFNQTDIRINIIASNPFAEEDMACAYYIRDILQNSYKDINTLDNYVVYEMFNSPAANKFIDSSNKDFSILDLTMSTVRIDNNFVMQIKKNENINIVKKLIQ